MYYTLLLLFFTVATMTTGEYSRKLHGLSQVTEFGCTEGLLVACISVASSLLLAMS